MCLCFVGRLFMCVGMCLGVCEGGTQLAIKL